MLLVLHALIEFQLENSNKTMKTVVCYIENIKESPVAHRFVYAYSVRSIIPYIIAINQNICD